MKKYIPFIVILIVVAILFGGRAIMALPCGDLGCVEKRIAKAENKLINVIQDVLNEGVVLPDDSLEQFNDLMDQTQSAIIVEDFELAGELAKEAKKSLKIIEDLIDKLADMPEENLVTGYEALETQLLITSNQINNELSIPLAGFSTISSDISVEGDTMSLTTEARKDGSVDLGAFRSSLLSGLAGWESMDVLLDDDENGEIGDSLDITFEKDYPVVNIEGKDYIPSSSVTISVTVEDDGFTEINYDIDITLEEI